MPCFRFPKKTQRITIGGSTGSGKTYGALWLLSQCDIDVRPWVILNPKKDPTIADVPTTILPVGSKPPKAPGLYEIQPVPEIHDAWVERFLWQCWQQEDIGLYIDEGYMIPRNSKAMLALLTQGRSKYIQMIMLTQRPVLCHPMMFSESDFLWVYRFNKPIDRDTISQYISADVKKRLPEFHSYWYDVGQDACFVLGPVPDKAELIASFDRFEKRRVRTM